MPYSKVTIAAAGSGKTRDLVDLALGDPNKRTLILTYTNENLAQIRRTIIKSAGVIPSHVQIQTWYPFLLRHCVRPYQYPTYSECRITGLWFPNDQGAFSNAWRFKRRANINEYYFANPGTIVGHFASDFSIVCDTQSGGLVIKRLERIYDSIFIDEVQDLAGYDLDLLKLLFASQINVEAVGDNRQVIYQTNYISTRNKGYRGETIYRFFEECRDAGLCDLEYKTSSFRCNQAICDFADRLYPDMPATKSENAVEIQHRGVFFVPTKEVPDYLERYSPQVLRYMKSAKTSGLGALNFGQAKGSTFERVLIFPTAKMEEYLSTGDLAKAGDIPKFYVGVTRARHSVAFVYDGTVFDAFSGLCH